MPTYTPTKLVRIIKRIGAREVFQRVPAVRKQLWRGEFWTDGYCIGAIGRDGSEAEVQQYTAKQGRE